MQNKSRLVLSLIINLGLLLTGSAAALSGLVIQLNYHLKYHAEIDKISMVFGMNYTGWSNSHLFSIVMLSFLAVIHFILHWKWYKTIVQKKLLAQNNLMITLTTVFITAAITGYIPLFIRMSGGSEVIRKTFIEIHDKISLVLLVYLIIHVAKRFRWFHYCPVKSRTVSIV
jgi:hypothetical protein